MKNEIRDYLKHSKQVKKYDSIKKMEHENIVSKNKEPNEYNENNIIKEEENESNFNNNENNNVNQNNFIEENPIQGQNNDQNENNVNIQYNEENKNQEEIIQDENQNQIENENENENDIEQNNDNNEININNNFIEQNNNLNNSQVSDTKNSNKINNDIELNVNVRNMKDNLRNIFNEIIYKSFDDFEKNINIKLNQINNRINDISLKISDFQSNQVNQNEGGFSKTKKLGDNTYSQSSYIQPSIVENNNSFYINSRKMRLNSIKDSKNHSVNTEDPDFNINNLNKKEDTSIDSEVTKTWKETLKLIEKGKINEGYLKLINSGDDIYLLRLICLTGPIIDKLDIEVAKRVLIRVNMISKSHQIQQLLIGLIKNSIKNNIFQTLEPNQQNYILDSLYEFSGLNNSIASEAAELYAELTK